jgi:hypothetical protein
MIFGVLMMYIFIFSSPTFLFLFVRYITTSINVFLYANKNHLNVMYSINTIGALSLSLSHIYTHTHTITISKICLNVQLQSSNLIDRRNKNVVFGWVTNHFLGDKIIFMHIYRTRRTFVRKIVNNALHFALRFQNTKKTLVVLFNCFIFNWKVLRTPSRRWTLNLITNSQS